MSALRRKAINGKTTKKKQVGSYTFPKFPLLAELEWLRDVSVWSQPTKKERADPRDAFLLGGDGYISARLGIRERVSTLERILAPYLSSYNFAENNNFFLEEVRPSRDFYPPISFTPTNQHTWRVHNTAIIVTAERDAEFELVTVNAVHPRLHVILRYGALKNLTSKAMSDIGISFSASQDIPFPIAGHRSTLLPNGENAILETVEELQTIVNGPWPTNTRDFERNRYLVRGLVDGKVRGYQDLFLHADKLPAKNSLTAVHYLAPGLDDTAESAIVSARTAEKEIKERGIAVLFQETYDSWMKERASRTEFESSEPEYTELLENNAILQKTVERATGGYTVIDDYTGSWMRDHNGSHTLLLDLGKYEDVRKSMDRYYALDRSFGSLISCYPGDAEPLDPLPPEPKWEEVEHFIPGDVPNFRTMWYAWYFAHTGDLEYIRERFPYMLGAFMRQELHTSGYLAKYCYDETYGIGPIGPMRKGLSCDNSFIALRGAQHLATFARLLGRNDSEYLREYAEHIHNAIERTFWLQKKGYYAMRVTPEGKLDHTPLSVGLLRPLWTGALAEYDDHAIRSALYTFEHLYQKNGFLKLIPSHDQTVTMAIGYLLGSMKKIGHSGIDRVLKDLLKWADPSGTFGEYLDDSPSGPQQCHEHLAHRSRMWESGINTDALFYTLTGFEPNAFEKKMTLHPYLPTGWKYFRAKPMRIGNSYFSLSSERGSKTIRYTVGGLSGDDTFVRLNLSSKRAGTIKVSGKIRDSKWSKNRFGIYQSTVEFTLHCNETIKIEL